MFSVASWAIILSRRCPTAQVQRQTATFLDVFRKSSKFSEVQAVCAVAAREPARRRLPGGLRRAQRAVPACGGPQPANPRAPAPRPTLKSLTAVDRALLRAATVEINKLEKRVTFLATIASVAPFIGLFGTVWES